MRSDFHENHAANLTVHFAGGSPPSWPAVRDLLARQGVAVKMRMIDGQPAFPDEAPAEGWREIRIAAADGMVTVRRDGDRLTFVTWGNAGPPLLQAVNALAWAFAQAGSGTIDIGEPGCVSARSLDAAAFLRSADLPQSVKSSPQE